MKKRFFNIEVLPLWAVLLSSELNTPANPLMHDYLDTTLNALLGLSFVFFPIIYILSLTRKGKKQQDEKKTKTITDKQTK